MLHPSSVSSPPVLLLFLRRGADTPVCLDFIWLSGSSVVAPTRSSTVNCINLLVLCAPAAATQPPAAVISLFQLPCNQAINLCMF